MRKVFVGIWQTGACSENYWCTCQTWAIITVNEPWKGMRHRNLAIVFNVKQSYWPPNICKKSKNYFISQRKALFAVLQLRNLDHSKRLQRNSNLLL